MRTPHTTRRHFILAASALGASGCIGSFGLTNMLFDWNRRLGNKYVSALVFFAFVVLPVYGLFLFVDAIALNVIEFWTGKHPVGGKRIAQLPDGRTLTTSATDEPELLAHEVSSDGVVERTFYTRHTEDGAWTLYDESMRPLVSGVQEGEALSVRDGEGRELLRADAQALQDQREAIERGESLAPGALDGARLSPMGRKVLVASRRAETNAG